MAYRKLRHSVIGECTEDRMSQNIHELIKDA